MKIHESFVNVTEHVVHKTSVNKQKPFGTRGQPLQKRRPEERDPLEPCFHHERDRPSELWLSAQYGHSVGLLVSQCEI